MQLLDKIHTVFTAVMVDPIIFIFLILITLGASLGVKVISTQNPVYSGLYLVLLFFLGSAISFLLGVVGDGENSTQKNVRRSSCTRCNYRSVKSLKTTVRTVLPIYSGAREPSSER